MGTGTTNIYWADTAASLRGLAGGADWVAVLETYSAAGDGGGGIFVWNTASLVDDDGTILNSNGFGGTAAASWCRLYSGALNVRWFGAKGDNSANDTTAITRAIAASVTQSNRAVFIPPGNYKVTSSIALSTQGLTISGAGRVATIIQATFNNTANAVFALSANEITVSGLGISCPMAYQNEWCGFSFAAAQACAVEDCDISYPYTGMFLASGECDWLTIGVSISNFSVTGIDFSGTDASGTYSNNSRIRILSEITGPGTGLSPTTYGIRLGGVVCTVEGGEISACKWPLELGGGGHTVKDVDVEQNDNGVKNISGSNWLIGGRASGTPSITGGALSYLGLDATGATASDLQLPAAVSGAAGATFSGLLAIMASYHLSVAKTVATGATATINFATSEWDSNSAVATGTNWTFTCPVAGVYRVSVTVVVTWGTGAGNVFVSAAKNGTTVKQLCMYAPSSVSNGGCLVAEIMCAATNTLSITVFNNTAQTVTLDPVNFGPSWVHIEKIQCS